MIVTVIWNDFNCSDDCGIAEVVEIRERQDGQYHTQGIVRQAMRQHGYSEELVNEAIMSYGLVGIIKGRVEWLA